MRVFKTRNEENLEPVMHDGNVELIDGLMSNEERENLGHRSRCAQDYKKSQKSYCMLMEGKRIEIC